MTDEKKHQNVLEKLRCLEEFRVQIFQLFSSTDELVDLLFVNQSQPEPESTETESTGLTQQMENTTVGEKRRQKQTSMTDFMKKIKKWLFFWKLTAYSIVHLLTWAVKIENKSKFLYFDASWRDDSNGAICSFLGHLYHELFAIFRRKKKHAHFAF